MNIDNKKDLRKLAIKNTLFNPTDIGSALEMLKYVQIDPIQSPAKAHDLILRHRVKDYHKGDFDKQFSNLDIEEDFLYAHGIMTRDIWNLLHPRNKIELSSFDKKVLDTIKNLEEIDTKSLSESFGNKRATNWWGGQSNETRMALERLHYYGLVKITGRRKGIRIYKAFTPPKTLLSKQERLEKLIITVVQILAPVTQKTLNQALYRIRRDFGQTTPVVNELIKKDFLLKYKVDGIEYVLAPNLVNTDQKEESFVKILAPFDPVVWDRIKFKHLWDWEYKFEAYVPKNKRVRGYYAMPLLWNNDMVGWANVDKHGKVELGYADKKPDSKEFKKQLDIEIYKLHDFLGIL